MASNAIQIGDLTPTVLPAKFGGNEFFVQNAIADSDLTRACLPIFNAGQNQQYAFFDRLPMLGKAAKSCGVNPADGTSAHSKTVDMQHWNARLTFCKEDLLGYLPQFEESIRLTNPDLFKSFNNNTPSTNTGILLQMLALNALLDANIRIAWFGDENAAVVSEEGDGVYKTGTDVALFQVIKNGLWKQYFAGVADGSIPRVTIAENAKTTYAEQLNLADGAALELFNKMYGAASRDLKRYANNETAKIFVTEDLYENYRATLREKTVDSGDLSLLTGRPAPLRYNGMEVVNMGDQWDPYIREQDNGTKWNLPHRAIMTLRENEPVFFPSNADMTNITMFYSQDSRQNTVDIDQLIDAKILREDLAVVAY